MDMEAPSDGLCRSRFKCWTKARHFSGLVRAVILAQSDEIMTSSVNIPPFCLIDDSNQERGETLCLMLK